MELKEILNNVIDWLKFAEAKNATFIAFNGAGIIGICSFIKDIPENYLFRKSYIFFLLIIFLISTIILLISFIPVLTPLNHKHKYTNRNSNVIFFGDLSQLTTEELLKKYCKNKKFKDIDKDIAAQIIINSRIALRKFTYFKYAIWLIVIGFFPLAILKVIYNIIQKVKNDRRKSNASNL